MSQKPFEFKARQWTQNPGKQFDVQFIDNELNETRFQPGAVFSTMQGAEDHARVLSEKANIEFVRRWWTLETVK